MLSGGGARGAYEAGVIGALVAQAGIKDGQRLPGADVVAGASIGALNGWFVATGQYSKLAEVWRTIGSERILRPKRQFAQLDDSSSGVLTRVYEALTLERGLITNTRGLVDEEPIREWIAKWIDPSVPLLVPYLLTVTNLTLQQRELFYRSPDAISNAELHGIASSLAFLAGRKVAMRKMLPGRHPRGNLGLRLNPGRVRSRAVYILPVGRSTNTSMGAWRIPRPSISPVRAKRINVVLLDPVTTSPVDPKDALEIGLESFCITQSRVRLSALRDAAVDTAIKRTFSKAGSTPEEKALLDRIPDVDLFQSNPIRNSRRTLPISTSKT